MIKKAVIEKIKKNLQSEKAELMAKSYSAEVDIDGDETDKIQGNIIATVTQTISSRFNQKLQRIDSALKRIEDKTFGACEECGEDIAEKRLEVNPYSGNCISCAEQLEMDEKQRKY